MYKCKSFPLYPWINSHLHVHVGKDVQLINCPQISESLTWSNLLFPAGAMCPLDHPLPMKSLLWDLKGPATSESSLRKRENFLLAWPMFTKKKSIMHYVHTSFKTSGTFEYEIDLFFIFISLPTPLRKCSLVADVTMYKTSRPRCIKDYNQDNFISCETTLLFNWLLQITSATVPRKMLNRAIIHVWQCWIPGDSHNSIIKWYIHLE